MSKLNQQFDRREFLRSSAIAAAAGALGISEAGLAETHRSKPDWQ